MKEDLVPYYKWIYGKFVLVGYVKKVKKIMTLKEKFLNSPCEKGYINTNVYRAENNVKIADNYAIEFAEWIGANDYKKYSNGWANFSTKATTAKKLLEIFKK